jgi:hypothetical protein
VDRVALGVGTVRWNAHVEPMVDKPAGEDPPSVLRAWHASVTSLCSASLSDCMLRALSQAWLCEQRMVQAPSERRVHCSEMGSTKSYAKNKMNPHNAYNQ